MCNTVAALCYFCENHGPRVVITCQTLRNSGLELDMECQQASGSGPVDGGLEAGDDVSQFYGNLYGGNEIIDDELRCAACSSFDEGISVLSKDHDTGHTFISTQVPINEKLNQILKQACLRSLSIEISAPLCDESGKISLGEFHSDPPIALSQSKKWPSSELYSVDIEKNGVVLFGDDEHWYTLSYTFKIKDAKARGFHRSYSVIVVCHDKLLLLRHYDFIVHSLHSIVTKLQEMTFIFFAHEQEMDSDLKLASNMKWTQHRLPHQFYPKQTNFDTSRSLKIIANDQNIFVILHRRMSTFLKNFTSLDKDIVLEGCPTQDMLMMMEMTNSGLLEEQELVTHFSPKQSLTHLANLRLIADHLNKIDSTLLSALLWQLVIGGQIVVRSSSLMIRRFFLLPLVYLLPIGCVRFSSNSLQYSHSYKHNFLGCPLNTEIPDEVQSETFLITLSQKEGNLALDSEIGSQSICTDDLKFSVDSFPVRPLAEKPAIVARYEQLLSDPLINLLTLDSAVQATKNDWLNNAKLIFQLRHQREAIDLDKILRIIKCKPQDSPVILFWQRGLSNRYRQIVLNTASNCYQRQELD